MENLPKSETAMLMRTRRWLIHIDSSCFAPVGLGSYVDGAIFPCSKAEIMICAEANEAPEHVLNAIESLPDGLYRTEGELAA